eukprot:1519304-Prymnesium_polylepis.1
MPSHRSWSHRQDALQEIDTVEEDQLSQDIDSDIEARRQWKRRCRLIETLAQWLAELTVEERKQVKDQRNNECWCCGAPRWNCDDVPFEWCKKFENSFDADVFKQDLLAATTYCTQLCED